MLFYFVIFIVIGFVLGAMQKNVKIASVIIIAISLCWFCTKSTLKMKIVLQKSKGAGNFCTDFAPIFFHARIIISNLQLTH